MFWSETALKYMKWKRIVSFHHITPIPCNSLLCIHLNIYILLNFTQIYPSIHPSIHDLFLRPMWPHYLPYNEISFFHAVLKINICTLQNVLIFCLLIYCQKLMCFIFFWIWLLVLFFWNTTMCEQFQCLICDRCLSFPCVAGYCLLAPLRVKLKEKSVRGFIINLDFQSWMDIGDCLACI